MATQRELHTLLGMASLLGMTTLAGSALAQDTSNLLVQANVGGSCVLGDGTSVNNDVTLDFGAFDGAEKAGTATIDYNCTAATNISIGLDGGLSPSGSDRFMSGPNGSSLTYGLFQDASHSTPWGLDANNDFDDGSATEGSVTVFGRINAQDVPATGVYSDTVLITLTTN